MTRQTWLRVVLGAALVLLVAPWVTAVASLPTWAEKAFASPPYVAAVIVGLYIASVLLARQHLIGNLVEHRGRARLTRLRSRLRRLPKNDGSRSAATALMDEAAALHEGRTPVERWTTALGLDLAVQTLLDEAELELLGTDTRDERVARLGALEVALEGLADTTTGRRLQRRIAAARKNDAVTAALVRELLAFVRAVELEKSEDVAQQIAKNLWLLTAGGMLLVVLAGIGENPQLLLFGALGSFVSRLFALLRSDSLRRTFRFTWTANMLGPLYGALVGYGVILVVVALRKLEVLGDAFDVIDWADGNAPLLLGLAFLLGFSERLVGRVVNSSDGLVPEPSTDAGDQGDQEAGAPGALERDDQGDARPEPDGQPT